jgi:hypothetical protein
MTAHRAPQWALLFQELRAPGLIAAWTVPRVLRL